MVLESKYHKELESLKAEHSLLETEIGNLMQCKVIDRFRLLDLKKRKLRVKESISGLEDMLYNNLTA
jgi:hypothetical protein